MCGSDGQTYPSPWALKVAACTSGNKIQIKHKGECKKGKHVRASYKHALQEGMTD